MNRFSNALTYALAAVFLAVALAMVLHMAGMIGSPLNYISYLFYAGITVAGLLKWRKDALGGYMSYGQAYGQATLINLLYSVLIAIWTFIFVKYIAPDFVDEMLLKAEIDMEKKGVPPEQISQAVTMMGKFMTPGSMVFFALLGNLIWMAIINLIVCAFVTKKKPFDPFVTVPPAFDQQMPNQEQRHDLPPNPNTPHA